MRLDQILVQLSLVSTRSQAQDLIRRERVRIRKNGEWKIAQKPGEALPSDIQAADISIDPGDLRFVSRGGLKLELALQHTHYSPTHKIALDVGLSTGGFADCLLQAGSEKVIGIDVGTDQLHPSLRTNPKLTAFEQMHLKTLDATFLRAHFLPEKFDLITVDVSFISLTHVFPVINPLMKSDGRLLALVKPQFELEPADLTELRRTSVIVKDPELWVRVKEKIVRKAQENNFDVLDYFTCSLRGQDGNQNNHGERDA